MDLINFSLLQWNTWIRITKLFLKHSSKCRHYFILFPRCPKIEVPKGCKLEAYPDLTKEFPDCCPKVVCPPGHPANKSGDSTDGKTGTPPTTDSTANNTNKRVGEKEIGSINAEKRANGDKRCAENKQNGSDTVSRGATPDVENLMNKEEPNRDSYKQNNSGEMLKNKTVALLEKESENEENRNPIGSVIKHTEATNKIDHTSKQKKTKHERGTDGKSYDRESNKNRKRRRNKERKRRVEVIGNESGSNPRKGKDEPRDTNETKIKSRLEKGTTKKHRREKAEKKINPLGNIDLNDNQDVVVKRSEKTKRNKKKKGKGNKEGNEDIRDQLSKIIKLPKKYI